METLKTQTVRAFKWNVLSQLVNQLLVFGTNLVLIRLLTPDEFGNFAVPFVLFSFFRFVHDFGFTDVIIREKNISHQAFSTIFWFTAFGAVGVAGLNYVMSPMVGQWTGLPVSVVINQWLSLALLGVMFFSALDARFRKNLNFRKVFMIEFFANILSAIPAIYMAWMGLGWQALVVKTVLYTLLLSVLSFVLTTDRPAFYFSGAVLKTHSGFAGTNIADQLLSFVYRNIDTLLISRYIGSFQLGLYDRAYKFLTYPVQQVSGSFSRVMFPALAHIQDDKERLADNFLRICRMVSLLAFPLMFGLALVSWDFTLVVFGGQWKDMAPLLAIFSILAVFTSFSVIFNHIFYITNRMKLLLRYSLITRPALVLVIWFATMYYREIFPVALYLAVASILIFFPLVSMVASCLGIGAVKIYKAIFPQLFITMLMAVGVVLCGQMLRDASPLVRLSACVTTGAVLYVSAAFLGKLRVIKEVRELLKW